MTTKDLFDKVANTEIGLVAAIAAICYFLFRK